MDIIKVNGTAAISISINKESGANMVAVSKAVKKQLEKLNLPEGIKYEILFNNADTVNKSISGVLDTAWQGGLFAVIILMIYLWNFRTVSIIAISIPMSIIITFTIMYFMGVTLNIISLAGLVLGIGMMVDNSIVVLENIFFYRNNGYVRCCRKTACVDIRRPRSVYRNRIVSYSKNCNAALQGSVQEIRQSECVGSGKH